MELTVLVTGAAGFVGRNLCAALAARPDLTLYRIDIQDSQRSQDEAIERADLVFHLAGVNRPEDVEDFKTVGSVVDRVKALMAKGPAAAGAKA